MNKISVSYNSDTLETAITINDRPFDTSRINGKEIADWAYPFMMRKVRWNGFYDEMVEALGGEKAFDLIFEGPEEALAELKEAWEDAPVHVVSAGQRNIVTIAYDADALSTEITVNGQPFDTSRINGKDIEDWVYPFMMRKVKWDGIFDELKNVLGTDEYEIQFFGDETAFKILKNECVFDNVLIKTLESKNVSDSCLSKNNNCYEKNNYVIITENGFLIERCSVADYYNGNQSAVNQSISEQIKNAITLFKSDHPEIQQIGFLITVDTPIREVMPVPPNNNDVDLLIKYILDLYPFWDSPRANITRSNKGIRFDKYFQVQAEIVDCANSSTNDLDEATELEERANKLDEEKKYYDSFQLRLKAAKLGNITSISNLGWHYQYGNGVAQDYEKAFEYYKKAAEQGNAWSQDKLGDCYYNGEGVSQDYTQAAKWYTKAAEQGNVNAQFDLGYCYHNGEGVSQNYAKAAECFTKAAEQGHADAQYNLAIYYDGGYGVSQDYTKAVKWYTKAAEQGHASAQNNLGSCYYNGDGISQDYAKAVEWFIKAAEQGHADAQNNLGKRYHNGEGISQDYAKAVEWFIKAAEQGHADAQNSLGNSYRYGYGVAQNDYEANKWFKKAAEQGNAFAQFNLGQSYEHGIGITQNYSKAFELYSESAKQEYCEAMYGLFVCYNNGYGVTKDDAQAEYWLRRAAEFGCEEAEDLLDIMDLESIPQQRNDRAFNTIIDAVTSDTAKEIGKGFLKGVGAFLGGMAQGYQQVQDYYDYDDDEEY